MQPVPVTVIFLFPSFGGSSPCLPEGDELPPLIVFPKALILQALMHHSLPVSCFPRSNAQSQQKKVSIPTRVSSCHAKIEAFDREHDGTEIFERRRTSIVRMVSESRVRVGREFVRVIDCGICGWSFADLHRRYVLHRSHTHRKEPRLNLTLQDCIADRVTLSGPSVPRGAKGEKGKKLDRACLLWP